MAKNITSVFVEQIPTGELSPTLGEAWWLPVFPVMNLRQNKPRLVYDASARSNKTSLNDHLLSGPPMNNLLRSVLMRFREEKFGFIADIESMFNNFSVPRSNKDFMLFFWHQNNDSSLPLTQYRCNTHIFGCIPSPAVASYCLQHCLRFPIGEGNVSEFIRNGFYVDDGLYSTCSVDDSVNLFKGTIASLEQRH